MFADCAADPECDRAFPNLRQVFLSIEGKIDGKVLKLSSQNRSAIITFNKFVSLLESKLEKTTTIPQIPLLVWSMAESIDGNATATSLIANVFSSDDIPEHLVKSVPLQKNVQKADGLNIAVICHEDWSWIDNWNKLKRQIAAYKPFVSISPLIRYEIACPMWNVGKADADFQAKVVSDIPTLMLTGNYDRLTAPMWTEEVAEGLSNSQIVRFKGIGHDVIDASLCAKALTADFIANPNESLPLDCVERMRAPEFITELP